MIDEKWHNKNIQVTRTYKRKEFLVKNFNDYGINLNSLNFKKTLPIECYIKRGRVAEYYNTLYLDKHLFGNEIFDQILTILIERETKDEKLEQSTLHDGIEIKKTLLFPSNLISFFNTKFTLKQLIEKNKYHYEIRVSPISITRTLGTKSIQINIETGVNYEFDPNLPFLSKPFNDA